MPDLLDSYTDSNGTDLTAHTADTGHIWYEHPNTSNNAAEIQSNKLVSQNSSASIYYSSIRPLTPDYSVQVDATYQSANGHTFYLGARLSTSANNQYRAYYSSGSWRLQALWNNAANASELGTWAQTLTSGQTYTVKITCSGSTIKLFIDGVERVSATDSNVSAAGRPGLSVNGATSSSSTGWQLDNYQASGTGTSFTPGDNWGWSDSAAFPPSVGSLGAGSVDYQGRVTFTATEGAFAPTTWKVYRSADNSTFVDITARCSLVDNGSTWTIIDKRPAYGSQAIAWGGTGYYKVRAYNGSTPSSADTSVVTVTGIDVDANASEKAQWDALHTLMSTQATRENDTHLGYPYSGHWLIAAANVAHKYADKRTEALADLNTWWTYVKGTQRNADKLYKQTSAAYSGYIYSEFCWRAVRDWIMCGYLIQEHDPTLAADLWACADETARATIDLLSRGSASSSGYGASWPDPAGATAWAGSTARSAGDVRRPTTGNGRMYRVISDGGTTGSSEPTWPTTDRGTVVDGTVTWQDCTNDLPRFQTSHAYSLGEIVRPTTGNSRSYRVTTAGTSGGSEPTWPTTAQGTVTSGSVVFRETSVSGASLYYGTYNGTSPYATTDFFPASDNDFTLETAAALAALLGTPACTNFYTGGSYRTTALSLLTDNVNHGLTMQVGVGATIKKPLFIEQYDSNYSIWSYEKLLTVVKFAGSLIPHAEAALTRFMDWLASDLSTEPRWSNGGDPDAYTDGKARWECTWRADLYRARGLPQPSFRPDKLIYTSTMTTATIYAENGQATSGWAGFTESGQTLILPCLHYGVYAALPSIVTSGDSWGWTDTALRNLPRPAGDSWAWSDSPTRTATHPRAVGDSWGWSDSSTRSGGPGTPRTGGDTWGWSDAAVRSAATRSRTAGDSWGWADTATITIPGGTLTGRKIPLPATANFVSANSQTADFVTASKSQTADFVAGAT